MITDRRKEFQQVQEDRRQKEVDLKTQLAKNKYQIDESIDNLNKAIEELRKIASNG